MQYTLQFIVLRAIREIFDYTSNRLRPPYGPTYIPTTSPVSGISGQQTHNGPSAQFVMASTPSTEPVTTYPTFAQTSQTAWPTYRSPPLTPPFGNNSSSVHTSPTRGADFY